MVDAYAIWRAGSDTSKARTIRNLWPELGDALDGKVNRIDPEKDEPQPMCRSCVQRYAIGTADGIPLCGLCVGKSEFVNMRRERVPGWRSGPRAG